MQAVLVAVIEAERLHHEDQADHHQRRREAQPFCRHQAGRNEEDESKRGDVGKGKRAPQDRPAMQDLVAPRQLAAVELEVAGQHLGAVAQRRQRRRRGYLRYVLGLGVAR